jgi:CBS domain containing-hemolysin-like protein
MRLALSLIPASTLAVAYAAGTGGEPARLAASWGWIAAGLVLGFLGSALFNILDHAIFTLEEEDIEALELRDSRAALHVREARRDVERTWLTMLSGVLLFDLVFGLSACLAVLNVLGMRLYSVILAAAAGTAAVLVFGELLPGLLAARYLKQLAPLAARWSRVFAPVLAPLSLPPLTLLRAGYHVLGLNAQERARSVEVESRLLTMIGLGEVDITLEEEEREMIDHALEFGEKTARDIMTPRERIIGLSVSASQEEALAFLRGREPSRFPVYKRSLDHIEGIVHRKQVLLNPEQDYHELISPAVFVTEDMELIELMALMKKQRRQIVVVLDEYGATSGVVSMEDLLQALVGPALDKDGDKDGDKEGGTAA